MIGIDYSHVWVNFVSKLIVVKEEDKIRDKVKDYFSIVQFSFVMLNWHPGSELFSNKLLESEHEKPDFYIEKDGIGIPIDVKLPSEVMDKADVERLFEQLRICNGNIGIYIGEHVRVFYRPSVEDELKVVIDAALTENDIEGFTFAELFYKNNFDIKLLRRDLDILYKLERVNDDFKVTGLVPKEWIKDRYKKRALL